MKKSGMALLLGSALLVAAANDPMAEKVKIQNQRVVAAAAKALNEDLPKRVDPYTKLVKIEGKGETLRYVFEIDAGPKSDEAVKKEGEARMQRNVTAGVCRSSMRFLKSGITIVYDYLSAHTKRPLFHIVVDEKRCRPY
ncbi:hypothetical protein [Hydrogenimonas sp. SS33]|uniref:hypothetical protein n=1 Tax=Hydrogenimonas leucolamina TaxID=2954236 RepID=UPI00336BF219